VKVRFLHILSMSENDSLGSEASILEQIEAEFDEFEKENIEVSE